MGGGGARVPHSCHALKGQPADEEDDGLLTITMQNSWRRLS